MDIIEERTALTDAELSELAQLLVHVVGDGASIGFLAPLPEEEAALYWKHLGGPDVHLWVAKVDGRIAGTVQLHLAMKANATHRAEIAKLMVHSDFRGKGIARQLMLTAEAAAQRLGRQLLVLDTRLGDVSNRLYQSMGYVEAGRIPDFAKSSNGQLDATVIYYKKL